MPQPSTGRDSFSLAPAAFWGMTGPAFDIKIAPRKLYERFGYPVLNDGDFESLGTYVFTSPTGAVVTVYFRAYDVWSLLVKLFKRCFWRSNKTCSLTVGAEQPEVAEAFCAWLNDIAPIDATPRPHAARVLAARRRDG